MRSASEIMEWIHLCPIPPRDLLAGLIVALDSVAVIDVILYKSNSKKMMGCAEALSFVDDTVEMNEVFHRFLFWGSRSSGS